MDKNRGGESVEIRAGFCTKWCVERGELTNTVVEPLQTNRFVGGVDQDEEDGGLLVVLEHTDKADVVPFVDLIQEKIRKGFQGSGGDGVLKERRQRVGTSVFSWRCLRGVGSTVSSFAWFVGRLAFLSIGRFAFWGTDGGRACSVDLLVETFSCDAVRLSFLWGRRIFERGCRATLG